VSARLGLFRSDPPVAAQWQHHTDTEMLVCCHNSPRDTLLLPPVQKCQHPAQDPPRRTAVLLLYWFCRLINLTICICNVHDEVHRSATSIPHQCSMHTTRNHRNTGVAVNATQQENLLRPKQQGLALQPLDSPELGVLNSCTARFGFRTHRVAH